MTPDVQLAQEAGLDVQNNNVTDEHLQTSVADIYAAGDVANAYHPLLGRHLRVEHWTGYTEPEGYNAVVLCGEPSERRFIAIRMAGNRVPAGMSVDVWDVMDPIRSLITSGSDVYDMPLSAPGPHPAVTPRLGARVCPIPHRLSPSVLSVAATHHGFTHAPATEGCHRSRDRLVVVSDNPGDRSRPWLSLNRVFPPWCW